MGRRLSLDAYVQGVLSNNRSVLGRAITLMESRRQDDQVLGDALLTRCMPHTGRSVRVGITGVPGVGKSTLLDAFGMHLIEQGLSVAVLAIDPSSSRTGGSILGDKTRMARLSVHPKAFVRPSPTDRHLGGVARKTRETMLLCEAAGYDVILVESVGVGQSEIVLAGMVDCFVALMLPNAGDELQGIKKGLLEWVDILAVNKADSNETLASRSRREYAAALHYLPHRHDCWAPQTLCVSGLKGTGLSDLWDLICDHRNALVERGALALLRQAQQLEWFESAMRDRLWQDFLAHQTVQRHWTEIESQILSGGLSVRAGTRTLLRQFKGDVK